MGHTFKDDKYTIRDDDFDEDKVNIKKHKARKGRKKKRLQDEINEQMIDEGLYGI